MRAPKPSSWARLGSALLAAGLLTGVTFAVRGQGEGPTAVVAAAGSATPINRAMSSDNARKATRESLPCGGAAESLAHAHAASDDLPAPPPAPTAQAGPSGPLYAPSSSDAARAAAADPDPTRKAVFSRIAAQPSTIALGPWLSPDVTTGVRRIVDAAAAAGTTPVLLVYQLPNRDAGAGYSAGGLADATTYRSFTAAVAAGIGGRSAVIILEPDALAQMNALSPDQQVERYALLNDAVDAYGRLGHTAVYLDAAHCAWTPASVMAQRLLRAGVSRARGFAVNVANFQPTAAEVARGRQIAQLTGGTHFVVDTGRNGNGAYRGDLPEGWCNPPGRALGAVPTLTAGDPALDGLLWIKNPGSSDGDCGRGNPAPGTFWPDYAFDLAANAGWS